MWHALKIGTAHATSQVFSAWAEESVVHRQQWLPYLLWFSKLSKPSSESLHTDTVEST